MEKIKHFFGKNKSKNGQMRHVVHRMGGIEIELLEHSLACNCCKQTSDPEYYWRVLEREEVFDETSNSEY